MALFDTTDYMLKPSRPDVASIPNPFPQREIAKDDVPEPPSFAPATPN